MLWRFDKYKNIPIYKDEDDGVRTARQLISGMVRINKSGDTNRSTEWLEHISRLLISCIRIEVVPVFSFVEIDRIGGHIRIEDGL